MKRTIVCVLAAFAAMAMPTLARAAITCSITSPGFSTAYSATAPVTNVTQTYFTVTCTRGSTSDPTSVNYSVTADNGLSSQGQRNRASAGGNRIQYDLYKDAACGTQWRGNTVSRLELATTRPAVKNWLTVSTTCRLRPSEARASSINP